MISMFLGGAQLVHVDRFLCCELALYFQTSKPQHFSGYLPPLEPYPFCGGGMKFLNAFVLKRYCSE